jgi:hypothetical protein
VWKKVCRRFPATTVLHSDLGICSKLLMAKRFFGRHHDHWERQDRQRGRPAVRRKSTLNPLLVTFDKRPMLKEVCSINHKHNHGQDYESMRYNVGQRLSRTDRLCLPLGAELTRACPPPEREKENRQHGSGQQHGELCQNRDCGRGATHGFEMTARFGALVVAAVLAVPVTVRAVEIRATSETIRSIP